MQISIYGFKKPSERKLVRHAINHFMSNLVHRNLASHLKIMVFKERKRDDLYGTCEADDRNRTFEISVYGRMSRDDLLRTLAHECAHVKQWATGERVDYKRYANKVKFQGKVYDTNKLSYPSEPWEQDANFKEEGLVVRFLADYPEYRH